MANKYFIGEIGFKTKKACEEYVRQIVNQAGICIINSSHEKFNFFINLLKNHSECAEKIGVGINNFYIIRNRFGNGLEMGIKRIDGSEIDFSWRHCCEFKPRPPDFNLTNAMRAAISGAVIEFKLHSESVCQICKTKEEPFDVDHEDPSFKTLKNNFLEETKLEKPTVFDDCPIYHRAIFRDEDEEFMNEWIQYHNQHCKLQILCKDCHRKKRD